MGDQELSALLARKRRKKKKKRAKFAEQVARKVVELLKRQPR